MHEVQEVEEPLQVEQGEEQVIQFTMPLFVCPKRDPLWAGTNPEEH